MTCQSCSQHRNNIAQAVKAGDVKKTVSTTVAAGLELGRRIATVTRKK